VRVSQLTGTNADFIAAKIPHLHEIITDDLDEVCNECDVLVITNKEKEFAEVPAKYPHKCIVDLVRQFSELDYDGNYEGISWGNINGNPNQGMTMERNMPTTEF
jgi:GDP-mannose 6-dehydrogenase